MKLSYSKKILVLAIIVSVVVLILNLVFTQLLLGKIFSINDKIKQINISSQEREKELNLRDLIATTISDREKLKGYFVGAGNAEAVKFTESLEELAEKSGVEQKKSLNYEAVAEMGASDFVTSIHFHLNISGQWSNVLNFIQAIENLPKVSYVSNVSLYSSGDTGVNTGTKKISKIWSADLDLYVIQLK